MIYKSFKVGLYIVSALFFLLLLGYRNDIKVNELEPRYFTAESEYIKVNDAQLHIRKRGIGNAIFLVHGSFSSLHTWEGWEDEISKNFKTISIDLPGHGLTGPSQNEVYTTDYYADLLFALADTLKIDTLSVVGNSMGGTVAWKMALRHPERIKEIILIDAAGYSKTKTNQQINKPLLFKLLDNNIIDSAFLKITPRFVFELNLRQVFFDNKKITDDQIDRYYKLMLREGNRTATLERLRNGGKNLQDSIQFIKTPTLILWGENDKWIPSENAYRFNSDIKDSKLVIYKNAGHVPMEEIPDETLQAAKEFLLRNSQK